MKNSAQKQTTSLMKCTMAGLFGLGLFMITALGGSLVLNLAAWALAIAVTGLSFATVRFVERLADHGAEEVAPAPAARQVAHASGMMRK